MKRARVSMFAGAGSLVLFFCGLLSGCGGMAYKPAGPVQCAAAISWEVAPEAEVTFLNCPLKAYAGWQKKGVLHLEIGLRNKAETPQRFRVQFFLPEENLAGGGLLPAGGSPPVLAPGKEDKGSYPVNIEKLPKRIRAVVRTISVD
jgi:hypothetical protein